MSSQLNETQEHKHHRLGGCGSCFYWAEDGSWHSISSCRNSCACAVPTDPPDPQASCVTMCVPGVGGCGCEEAKEQLQSSTPSQTSEDEPSNAVWKGQLLFVKPRPEKICVCTLTTQTVNGLDWDVSTSPDTPVINDVLRGALGHLNGAAGTVLIFEVVDGDLKDLVAVGRMWPTANFHSVFEDFKLE